MVVELCFQSENFQAKDQNTNSQLNDFNANDVMMIDGSVYRPTSNSLLKIIGSQSCLEYNEDEFSNLLSARSNGD